MRSGEKERPSCSSFQKGECDKSGVLELVLELVSVVVVVVVVMVMVMVV